MSNKNLGIATISLIALLLTGCWETRTSNAKETYKFWAGTDAPTDLELLNGQYWESAHWSKEYILYLKFIPTKAWWDAFLKQNSFSADKGNWTVPDDAPEWFKPSANSTRYSSNASFDQGSRYFRDKKTGIAYIYEIQL